MKFADLQYKKILYLHWPVSKYAVHEGEVKDISPSKNFIKINQDWFLVENVRILEVFNNDPKGKLGFS